MTELIDLSGWLERWCQERCDDEWEQEHGISIRTLDNPGWLVTADPLSANVRETAARPSLVEMGEPASSRAFIDNIPSCQTLLDGSDGEGQATEVHRGVQAADPRGGRRVRARPGRVSPASRGSVLLASHRVASCSRCRRRSELVALRVEDAARRAPRARTGAETWPWREISISRTFLAGKAFLAYRRRGGAKRSPIPDFYVGAHAVVGRMQLLTRDAARYRTYFPGLKLVAP
jgi:predicted nucleic acid-binding protein